jgi:hypothetical protein
VAVNDYHSRQGWSIVLAVLALDLLQPTLYKGVGKQLVRNSSKLRNGFEASRTPCRGQ